MDRVEIKEEAKKIIKTNKWNVWKPSLVIALISFIFTLIALIIGTLFNADNELVTSICESILSFVLLPTTVGLLAII